MHGNSQGTDRFTQDHYDGLNQRRVDQDRTLLAIHELERTLAEAAPPRQEEWLSSVLRALATLEDAMRTEAENAERPDSLLSDIAFNQRRLRNRVRGLRVDYHRLHENTQSLQDEFATLKAHPVDFADIRQRLGWLASALRHQRARESDLIYEAYYDAFQTDLSTDAARAS